MRSLFMGSNKSYAEESSQRTGGAEGCTAQPAGHSYGQEGHTGAGRLDGNFCLGSGGQDWLGRLADSSVVGGIVGQLIKDTRDRLAEVDECVAWYQRERERVVTRLEELEKLAEAAVAESDGAAAPVSEGSK